MRWRRSRIKLCERIAASAVPTRIGHADQSLRTGDNYRLEDSHVPAALIRRLHEAKSPMRQA